MGSIQILHVFGGVISFLNYVRDGALDCRSKFKARTCLTIFSRACKHFGRHAGRSLHQIMQAFDNNAAHMQRAQIYFMKSSFCHDGQLLLRSELGSITMYAHSHLQRMFSLASSKYTL